VLDLDRFKEVNDSNGHAAGDAVLQTIAEVLRKRLRTTDLVARVGGDEFALMIGHVDGPEALETVDELLGQIRDRIATMAGAAARVTVSAGIATFDRDHPTTVAQIIEAADTALYDAKRSGRARATLAPMTWPDTQ
jgi:diguanylate cyclase (GGDEF)-like protein